MINKNENKLHGKLFVLFISYFFSNEIKRNSTSHKAVEK